MTFCDLGGVYQRWRSQRKAETARAQLAMEQHRNRTEIGQRLAAARDVEKAAGQGTVSATPPAAAGEAFPASDPGNEENWNLNKDLSNEFEGDKLNTKRWLIQGTEGEFRSNFIGRAPSQFSTENVRVEDGKLKLQTRWDPDFDFSKQPDKDGVKHENITTAAVISREQFHYGYMEIKCKAANASITSSFWLTGKDSELDIFEFNGAPSDSSKHNLETKMMTTIIGCATGSNVRMWRETFDLRWKVAWGFHVYGCEWSEDGLKVYAEGKLMGSVTKEELGEKWVLINPCVLWVDSETFPWQGIPNKSDLPADYEIEYIRVWQK